MFDPLKTRANDAKRKLRRVRFEARDIPSVLLSRSYRRLHQLEHFEDIAVAEFFLAHTASRLVSPHPLLDCDWYWETYPDTRDAGYHPLQHYLTWGHKEGRWPHPLVDEIFIKSQAKPTQPGLITYLESPEEIHPNPLFASDRYVARCMDEIGLPFQTDPLTFYVEVGHTLGHDPTLHSASNMKSFAAGVSLVDFCTAHEPHRQPFGQYALARWLKKDEGVRERERERERDSTPGTASTIRIGCGAKRSNLPALTRS